jgi:hypothetical protein
MQLKISRDDLARIGSHSIIGLAFEAGWRHPDDLEILFEVSSLGWRREHDGPVMVWIPEYVVSVVCQDVLALIEQGVKVTVSTYEQDPKEE